MRPRLPYALILAPLLAAACSGPPPDAPAERSGTEPTAQPGRSPIDAEVLANLTYLLDGKPFQLVDGRSERQAGPDSASRATVVLDRERVAFGNFFGNAEDDAAAILVASGGGSGSFVHLAAVGRRRGLVRNLGSALLGDRVEVRSIEIAGRRIRLELVEHGPDDPACCPTVESTGEWELRSGRLVRVEEPDG